MNLENHEIWNLAVPDVENGVDSTEQQLPNAAPGRLYASAGAPPHPDAIVALPHYVRTFVSVAELPESPAPQAPLISDPAIAEMLAPTPPQSETEAAMPSFDWAKGIEVAEDPFKDWYAPPAAEPSSAPSATALDATPEPPTPRTTAPAVREMTKALTSWIPEGAFDLRTYTVLAFVVTAFIGVIDALVGGTIGRPFGAALIVSTAFGAFRLEPQSRWAGWVMPAYIAIAAILVAGQFADGAPGFNAVGQVLLVGTTLITVAPWLAIATLIGAVLPRFRRS